ncbi:MAG: hypothetical protein KIS88_10315 [Anaerolineales bacterium]|nr:hypothetical protein [Anaerolineales bacterium]
MPNPARERILVTLLQEIAEEQGYTFTPFSQNWILRLEKDGQARHIFGFNFEINSATAHMLAGDKAGTAALLKSRGIPCIEHRLFLNPNRAAYIPDDGHWQGIMDYATLGQRPDEGIRPLVAKPNEGTGGLGVAKVNTQAELEKAVQSIFQKGQSLSLSPYHDIKNEYRLMMLDGECQLAYSKQRPQLVGDGASNLRTLLERALVAGELTQAQAAEALEQHEGQLEHIPSAGDLLTVGWKHNLSAGASPEQLQPGPLLDTLLSIAQAAQRAINIRFASIDVVEVEGELQVLEVNSGIMMEHFARHLPENRATAKAIYARAVEKMFVTR